MSRPSIRANVSSETGHDFQAKLQHDYIGLRYDNKLMTYWQEGIQLCSPPCYVP